MRSSTGAILLLLILAPESVRAQVGGPSIYYGPHSSACAPQRNTVRTPPKPTLLADRKTGRLIEAGGTLTVDTPSSSGSGVKYSRVNLACSASTPLPAEEAASFAAMASRASRSATLASGKPLIAARVTSGFGPRVHPLLGGIRMHSGIDLAAPMGSPIFATDSGRVRAAGWQGGYGIAATIDHPGGLESRYGHMSRLNVVAGQRVRKGEVIGFVGSTGLSTGPHLHYEMRFRGQAINPAPVKLPQSKALKATRGKAR